MYIQVLISKQNTVKDCSYKMVYTIHDLKLLLLFVFDETSFQFLDVCVQWPYTIWSRVHVLIVNDVTCIL